MNVTRAIKKLQRLKSRNPKAKVSLGLKSRTWVSMPTSISRKRVVSKKKLDKVFVIWNPLHEQVVCVHSKEDENCPKCRKEIKRLEGSHYFIEGDWYPVDLKPLKKDE